MPARKSNAPERLIVGLVLASMTMVVIGYLTKYVGSSMFLSDAATMLSTPALAMTRLTANNPVPWGPVFIAWGIGFYWVVWFIILTALWGTRSGLSGSR
jgi:hypothetical protein